MTIAVGTAAAVVATGGAAAVAVPAVLEGASATALGTAAAGTAAAGTAAAGTAATTAAILSGPLGWILLGTQEMEINGQYTFDCWKPILHDESIEPSAGILIRDIITDSRIKSVKSVSADSSLSNLIVKNIWGEQFYIDYICLPNGDVSAHAMKI